MMEIGFTIAFLTGLTGLTTAMVALIQAVGAAREGRQHMRTCIAFVRASKTEAEDTLRNVLLTEMNRLHLELNRGVQAIIIREMTDIRKCLLKDQGE